MGRDGGTTAEALSLVFSLRQRTVRQQRGKPRLERREQEPLPCPLCVQIATKRILDGLRVKKFKESRGREPFRLRSEATVLSPRLSPLRSRQRVGEMRSAPPPRTGTKMFALVRRLRLDLGPLLLRGERAVFRRTLRRQKSKQVVQNGSSIRAAAHNGHGHTRTRRPHTTGFPFRPFSGHFSPTPTPTKSPRSRRQRCPGSCREYTVVVSTNDTEIRSAEC